MRSWTIWKHGGFSFILGEDTSNSRTEVIEKEPLWSLVKEVVERYPNNPSALPGIEFWDALKRLVAFTDKRT